MAKQLLLLSIIVTLGLVSSCKKEPIVATPDTYEFTRDGNSTVFFGGQTTRIEMGEELIVGLLDFEISETTLLEMYSNATASGEDANPFASEALNESTKSIRSKVAASQDFFFTNTVDGTAIKNQFSEWISAQVNEIFPNRNVAAEPGLPGQIADDAATRYVNAKGIEYNQLINKGLIGALMVDQALNNYLSPDVLDAADNQKNNNEGITEEGEDYTTMEHKWDEAYGYVYGNSANPADPNKTIGLDDNFLNRYVGKVEEDADFGGIANEIFEAFKLGRAAIVVKDYELRDEQAAIIKQKISEVVAIRAIYYLQQARFQLELEPVNYGGVLHDLSEAYGFIYSFQFTRRPDTNAPFFTKDKVDSFINDLMNDGENGLWDATPTTLEIISEAIAAEFDFNVDMITN